MPQFHETIMGKRFIEGTIPSLVRAVENLNDKLEIKEEPQLEYVTHILIGDVSDNIDREQLENIENQKFNSIDEVFEVIKDVHIYPITDYMDLFNNDGENEYIKPKDNWFGYVQIKK